MNGRTFVYAALCAFLAVSGWLAGSHQPVEAQSVTAACEWHMFGGNVAGTGGSSTANEYGTASAGYGVYGTTWMYNGCTGEVRRMFNGCGDAYPDGCAFVLPVLSTSESAAGFEPNRNLQNE